MNLSAVVITKNEEGNIKDCLDSLAFCDEVIVVDDYSNDDTVRIAKELGAQVYRRLLNYDFAGKRNFGLSKAKGKWVLFIDADERVSEALTSEISNFSGLAKRSGAGKFPISNGINGVYFRRVDYMWGKLLTHGEVGSTKLLRMAKKESGVWKRRVHEYWDVDGETIKFKNPILHYPHPTLREFIKDISEFSTLHAQANIQEGKRATLVKIIIWPLGKFLYNFIYQLGFLDGLRGFIVATVMSFHSFLAWSKLWFSQN